jgi:NOL1/NOP2/fmu family ribosome biogenesis protein
LASLRVKTVGVPVARWVRKRLKPTSIALQLFGKYATKNMVRLEPLQLEELLAKKELKGEFPLSPGYVIISTETVLIGCGLYLPGRLISQFPRHVFANQSLDSQPAD